ncbi:flagellar hook-length control protein FliK [Roseibium sp. M-1]
MASAAGSQSIASPVRQIAEQLRQPLAEQQTGLGSLFAQIGSLMNAQSSGAVSLPDPVVRAMQQILGLRLNTSQSMTGSSLQTAVQLSGQFREAQLALPSAYPAGLPDLKSALLSFKTLLQQLGARSEIARPAGQPPAPSLHGSPQGQAQQAASGYWAGAAPQNLTALLKETDSALARIRLTQLANTRHGGEDAPRMASRPMDLVLELPLALGQETAVLQMQIGRDGNGKEEGEEDEPSWRLRFALDLTATGPLEAAISLRGGGTYASLWVDRKETFDALTAQRETMEAAFADAGLDLQDLRLIRGLPQRTAARYGAMIDRQS